ncbi:MAG: SMP-30/gluconolactonase/LRE family protein [Chloroflexi bacterium]|nr:SMP-30/gluconolactonase/LRE family protein [Chloroflexota bacterium]
MAESEQFEIFDDEFQRILGPDPSLKLLADTLTFAEGVCWLPDQNKVIVSDIPNNRIVSWSESDGSGIYREPSDRANGNTVDREGRVVSCLTSGRAVVREEHDGSMTTIADFYDGGKLTSPNDVAVKSDGSIWFTDPDYGFLELAVGHGDKPEQNRNRVYRVDPDTLDIEMVSKDFDKPNGIAFSPDESVLYVSDTGRTHGEFRPHRLMAFDLAPNPKAARPARKPTGVRRYRALRARRFQGRRRRKYVGGVRRWCTGVQSGRGPARKDPHPRGCRQPFVRKPGPPNAVYRRNQLHLEHRTQHRRGHAANKPGVITDHENQS